MPEVKMNKGRREIYFNGGFNKQNSQMLITNLKDLEAEEDRDDIDLYLNSNGGSLDELFAIYDIMHSLKCDINIHSIGCCTSAGAYLLMFASGERIVYENTRIMIHELMYWYGGSLTDVEIRHEENKRAQRRLEKLVARHTPQPLDKIKDDLKRDKWMNAEEAKEYGMVDKIIKRGDE